jgi:tRNA pseudouridine55 synthase
MDGILNINKPAGMTSFKVVSIVRRCSSEKRVGHAGTLDPLATGVLPVHLGQATRVVEYMMDATKTYLAEIEFGTTTDTFDAEGKITARADAGFLKRELIESALESFQGEISQVPPAYSAIKQQGTPSYRLARAGIAVVQKARPVRIDRLTVTDWQPPVVTIEVDCSKGTYIRSLAHDLGQALGCGAYLKSLVRLRCGIFNINEAITLDEAQTALPSEDGRRLLHPVDCVLGGLQRFSVDDTTARAIKDGIEVTLEGASPNALCRAYTVDGKFLAILRFDVETALWHPDKVFHLPDANKVMEY